VKGLRIHSPRLTIILLIALAVGGAVGVLIPQGLAPEDYARGFGVFSHLIRILSLDRAFSSWWFLALLAMLLVNLGACLQGSLTRARRRMPATGYAALASPALHVAIFLVAIGAILGRVPGLSLRESAMVIEGDQTRVTNTEIHVMLKDFWMKFDDGTGAVSSYISEVVFQDAAGQAEARIEVNRPANFRGCQFQQVGWGLAGVWMDVTNPQGETLRRVLPLRQAQGTGAQRSWEPVPGHNIIELEGEDAALVVTIYYPEAVAAATEHGVDVHPTGEYPKRQFALLRGVTGIKGGEHQFAEVGWAGDRAEVEWKGWKVNLGDPVFYSVFGVRRDPGLPFVWTGFLLMTAALMVIVLVPTNRPTSSTDA